jgi:hypothetical protein
MQQGFPQLCRAALIHASSHRLAFCSIHFPAAHRTSRRHNELPTIPRLFRDADNLWDNIASSLQQDAIVNLDTQTLYLVFVVQSRITYRGATELNRFQNSDRS